MRRFRVVCSNGFQEQPFETREAAEQWVEKFDEARKRRPDIGLCDGEHTVEERNAG